MVSPRRPEISITASPRLLLDSGLVYIQLPPLRSSPPLPHLPHILPSSPALLPNPTASSCLIPSLRGKNLRQHRELCSSPGFIPKPALSATQSVQTRVPQSRWDDLPACLTCVTLRADQGVNYKPAPNISALPSHLSLFFSSFCSSLDRIRHCFIFLFFLFLWRALLHLILLFLPFVFRTPSTSPTFVWTPKDKEELSRADSICAPATHQPIRSPYTPTSPPPPTPHTHTLSLSWRSRSGGGNSPAGSWSSGCYGGAYTGACSPTDGMCTRLAPGIGIC